MTVLERWGAEIIEGEFTFICWGIYLVLLHMKLIRAWATSSLREKQRARRRGKHWVVKSNQRGMPVNQALYTIYWYWFLYSLQNWYAAYLWPVLPGVTTIKVLTINTIDVISVSVSPEMCYTVFLPTPHSRLWVQQTLSFCPVSPHKMLTCSPTNSTDSNL